MRLTNYTKPKSQSINQSITQSTHLFSLFPYRPHSPSLSSYSLSSDQRNTLTSLADTYRSRLSFLSTLSLAPANCILAFVIDSIEVPTYLGRPLPTTPTTVITSLVEIDPASPTRTSRPLRCSRQSTGALPQARNRCGRHCAAAAAATES